MGTWGIGPFENDAAADFADALDQTPRDEREGVVRAALARAVQSLGYLESPEGAEAVAAAALIAAQRPDGEPINSNYGPDKAVPRLPNSLQTLAVEALDRVIAESSELSELWDETADSAKWRESISGLRAVLAAGPNPQGDPA